MPGNALIGGTYFNDWGGIKRWKLPVHEGNQLDPGIYPELGVDTFQMVSCRIVA